MDEARRTKFRIATTSQSSRRFSGCETGQRMTDKSLPRAGSSSDPWESSTWEGHARWQLGRTLAATPLERLLWLEEALELALPASDGVAIARADILRAEGEVKKVRADLLPQLTGTATYTRTLKSQFSTGSGTVDTTATTFCNRFSAALAAGFAPVPW